MMLLLSTLMVFAQESTPVTVVDGAWKIVSRSCSSGAQVIDSFVMGRDRMEVKFMAGQYDAYTKVDFCNYWSTGKFTVYQNSLTVYDVVGSSNCTHNPPQSRGTVFYTVTGNQMTMYSSVFQGWGGACPKGDMLLNTFQR